MKANIARQIVALAEFYDKLLSSAQIEMYVDDLSVLTLDELIFAIKSYRTNPENTFFPLPAKLIAIVKPIETEKDIGQIVAARIITAIGKCGHNNIEDAKVFIGELGWEVVRLQGGWLNLCCLSTEEIKSEQPRLRELAITINKKSKIGNVDEAPKLPGKNSEKVLSLIATTMKKIPGGENG